MIEHSEEFQREAVRIALTSGLPRLPWKVLDDLVLDSVEKQVPAPERLRTLLSDVLDVSDQKRV